jgi:hypothetical protein
MTQSCQVLLDVEVSKYLHGGLIFFLERFLKGRPGWLE